MRYEDLIYRQIFMDGRELPKDPSPSFMGYSVGRWDGDTLVVDSAGFNDRTWLDFGGHPHSESLKMTERIRRTNLGRLEVEVRLEDRTFYARPWTVPVRAELVADTEMIEYVCNENQKDVAHLVGKASDEKKLAVRSNRRRSRHHVLGDGRQARLLSRSPDLPYRRRRYESHQGQIILPVAKGRDRCRSVGTR